jgi:uncharacterized membrane protein
MWFIGLIVGLAIGAGVASFEGAFYGAVLGALAGYALKQALGRQVESRLHTLEDEVKRLRAALDSAIHRVTQLEDGYPAAQAQRQPATSVAPAAATDLPEFELEPEPQAPALRIDASEFASVTDMEATTPTPEVAPASRVSKEPSPSISPNTPSRLGQWLFGGNTVVRVGVVVLFFGVAFLLKYAYEHTHVPIELRLTGVAMGAIALLAIGWRLRKKVPGYALALQGGGIGVLYLTVFGAFRLFGLLPPTIALALLFLIAALSAVLAVLQNSQSLAILGASGGFLAPILASTGGGSHVMLFSYYAVLNLGILGIAWYKAWRPLNLVGFAFTFGIGILWGAQFYRPELFGSTEPFLLLFFLMYLAIPLLFAHRQASRAERYVDGTLVFGVPIVAFGMQLRLVHGIEYGAAFSALAVSLVYLVLARSLYARRRDELRMLVEAFLALGVVFATLAVPLALDGRWTAATWALEGAAVVWIGVRQKRLLARIFGLLLQIGAGIAFFFAIDHFHGATPVLNSFAMGCAFLALAGLFCDWYLERNREVLRDGERSLGAIMFAWGLAWWAGGGLHEIDRHVAAAYRPDATLLFIAASCVAFSVLWRRLSWRNAVYPALALLPLMALVAGFDAIIYARLHPFAGIGYLAWPAAFAAQYWLLRRHDVDESPLPDHLHAGTLDYLHAGTLWLLAAVGAWEMGWAIDQLVEGKQVWPLIAWALIPGALLLLLALRGERIAWPVRPRLACYLLNGAAPLATFLWCWVLYANIHSDGDPSPLPYIPLLNPLDIAQIAALLIVVLWLRTTRRLELIELGGERAWFAFGVIGAAAFIAANGVLLRTLHHWAGIPFALDTMLHSMLVQAALSIFWSLLALCAMAFATRMKLRILWIAGAALMGVVVIKLFLVDLSNVGGVERIVSFIGVGVLMLLIGYLSPVPPKTVEQVG